MWVFTYLPEYNITSLSWLPCLVISLSSKLCKRCKQLHYGLSQAWCTLIYSYSQPFLCSLLLWIFRLGGLPFLPAEHGLASHLLGVCFLYNLLVLVCLEGFMSLSSQHFLWVWSVRLLLSSFNTFRVLCAYLWLFWFLLVSQLKCKFCPTGLVSGVSLCFVLFCFFPQFYYNVVDEEIGLFFFYSFCLGIWGSESQCLCLRLDGVLWLWKVLRYYRVRSHSASSHSSFPWAVITCVPSLLTVLPLL